MPVISKFYGIVIGMFVVRTLPARFHAIYGEQELVVAINPIRIVEGRRHNECAIWFWNGRHSISGNCRRHGID